MLIYYKKTVKYLRILQFFFIFEKIIFIIIMSIFKKKPKNVEDIAYKLFLKNNDLPNSTTSKQVFD